MAFTVLGVLGRGGHAVVELVEDEWGRRLARKRVDLLGSAFEMDRARRRIRREAEVLSRLHHPGIVPLLGVEDEAGSVVLVMPHLPGGSLADRVRRSGPRPPAEVAGLADALLPALAAAHRAGVVHRDITPSNVLFDAHGRPCLADFGTAVTAELTVGLTAPGQVMGTPAFMAPEQARGEPATGASDVFGLGATLAYALTGVSPLLPPGAEADAASTVRRSARGRVQPLPAWVPSDLRRRVDSMLAPDPTCRPSAAALAGGSFATHPAEHARARERWWTAVLSRRPDAPAAGHTRSGEPAGRRRATAVMTGGAVLALALVAGVVTAGVVAVGKGRTLGSASGRAPATSAAPPTTACTPQPYRPCGQPVAPFTDGQSCVDGHADYDAVAANGCEAAPDGIADGTALVDGRPLQANLVPATDVDTFRMAVTDKAQLFCDGRLTVTLTAPRGVTDRIEVFSQAATRMGSAQSTDGVPARVAIADPSCGGDDTQTLTVKVSSVNGHTAADYRLERSGSF